MSPRCCTNSAATLVPMQRCSPRFWTRKAVPLTAPYPRPSKAASSGSGALHHHVRHDGPELRRVDRLGEKAPALCLHALPQCGVALGGEHDDRHFRAPPAEELGDDVRSAAIRQPMVEQQQVRCTAVLSGNSQRLLCARRQHDLTTPSAEQGLQAQPHARIVLHGPNAAAMERRRMIRCTTRCAPAQLRFLSGRRPSSADQRDFDGKDTAAPGPGAQTDTVAEAVGDPPDDREAEARTALARRPARIEALKLEKDAAIVLSGDAGTRVPDLDAQRTAGPPASHEEASPPAIADRIGKIVLQDAPQQRLVGVDYRTTVPHPQPDPAGAGEDAELAAEGLEQRLQLKITLVHLECPGLQT